MTKKIFLFITTVMVVINFTGCAFTSFGDKRVSSKKARIIFEIDSSVELDKVTKGLYDAVSYRVSNLKENENLLPENLPAKPASPNHSQMFGRGMVSMFNGNPQIEMMQLDTSNAYYTVSGAGGMTSGFNAKAEYYKGAVYPYKGGYKVYLYLFYQEGTDGIIGTLIDATVKAIVGKDGVLLYMAQVRDKFKELVPELVIKSQNPSKLNKIELNSIGWAKDSDK